MDKRRMFVALLTIMVVIGILLVRILWIQTASVFGSAPRQADLVTRSVLQRENRLQLDSGRGNFLDRTGQPLTGDTYPALLVFPVRSEQKENPDEVGKLCTVLDITREDWSRFRKGLKTPGFWSGNGNDGLPVRLKDKAAGAIESLHLEGLAIVPYGRRYLPPYLAAQLIGYIGQNPDRVRAEFAPMLQEGRLQPDSLIGAAGLEKTFEPLLSGLGGSYISLYTDARSRPIPGIGYRLHAPDNPYYPLQIVTALDGTIQSRMERLADLNGLKDGAIVVLDVRTADLIAMVSRPAFHPDSVGLVLDGWRNRALKEAVPGSVFKTVVAAAALEYGVVRPDETFECKGALGKYHFTCWKAEGHGKLTFREGYAQSCNIVFGEVMKRLTPEQLESTAERLGVGKRAGWEGKLLRYPSFQQLDGEEVGRIWAQEASRTDEGASLQTSIGQRDVRMTPLQAANMVVTLLNGGEVRSVRAVKEVRYRTGRVLASFPERRLDGKDGKLTKRTAEQLTEWMKDVVANGTATYLQSAQWDLAGKSGTAQSPGNGAETYNQWFVGYGPAQNPRYAAAVVSLGQKRSGQEALVLFRQVMDALARDVKPDDG